MTARRMVVTGASTGMGAAFTELVRKDGAEVVALDIVTPTVDVDEYIATDLSDPGSIDSAVEQLGAFDVLVNCAGVPAGRFSDDQVMAVNYLGLRHLTNAAFERINDHGNVLNIASMAGHRYQENLALHKELAATESFEAGAEWYRSTDAAHAISSYLFSKQAVWWFTMETAVKGFERRIRSNSVCPGLVNTPLFADFSVGMTGASKDRFDRSTARPLEADEIARVMAYLLSADAERINGVNLLIDGGFIASQYVEA